LMTIPGPTITKLPYVPIKVRTEQVIEGINLVPPNGLGLSYRFVLTGVRSRASSDRCVSTDRAAFT
jgi:hypothetical protein